MRQAPCARYGAVVAGAVAVRPSHLQWSFRSCGVGVPARTGTVELASAFDA